LGVLVSETPLYIAAGNGHTAVVRALLAAGASTFDADSSTLGPLGVLFTETPLFRAASQGNAAVVRALLDANSSPSAGSSVLFGIAAIPPLKEAKEKGHTDVAALLTAALQRQKR
jgi:ankyrin repeat protein